jgi:hypothetical protein
MTLEARKMKALRAARASALRQAVRPESRDYEARAKHAACMVVLSLQPIVKRDAVERAKGNDARCAFCPTYFNRTEHFTCPECESQFHWPI